MNKEHMKPTQKEIKESVSLLEDIANIAMGHANPYDKSMHEWELVYNAADEIHELLIGKRFEEPE